MRENSYVLTTIKYCLKSKLEVLNVVFYDKYIYNCFLLNYKDNYFCDS